MAEDLRFPFAVFGRSAVRLLGTSSQTVIAVCGERGAARRAGWQIRQHNVRLASGLDNYTPTVQCSAASAYSLTAVVDLT